MEAVMMESSYIVTEITSALKNIDNWMAPQYVQKDLLNKMNDVYILPEPFGVALILGAWNYPVQLTMTPLVGAIAAGKLESTVASPLLASYPGCPTFHHVLYTILIQRVARSWEGRFTNAHFCARHPWRHLREIMYHPTFKLYIKCP